MDVASRTDLFESKIKPPADDPRSGCSRNGGLLLQRCCNVLRMGRVEWLAVKKKVIVRVVIRVMRMMGVLVVEEAVVMTRLRIVIMLVVVMVRRMVSDSRRGMRMMTVMVNMLNMRRLHRPSGSRASRILCAMANTHVRNGDCNLPLHQSCTVEGPKIFFLDLLRRLILPLLTLDQVEAAIV
jgi:hypothetical protein